MKRKKRRKPKQARNRTLAHKRRRAAVIGAPDSIAAGR